MSFLSYLQIGDIFSIWLKSLHELFTQNYEGVYAFLFNGATLEVSGVLGAYGQSLSLTVPDIPILTDIVGGCFTLLFFDTNFVQMPFYYSFLVSLTRITFTVLIIDMIKKLWNSLPFT